MSLLSWPLKVLFFKKKQPNGARPQDPGAKHARQALRMPVAFDVVYCLEGRRGQSRAQATDLSAGGLRLCCAEDLIAGCIVCLDFTLPDDFLNDMRVDSYIYEDTAIGSRREPVPVRPPAFAPMSLRAKVLTNFFDRSRAVFAHGVAFLDIDRKTTEELERFITLWQSAFGPGNHDVR